MLSHIPDFQHYKSNYNRDHKIKIISLVDPIRLYIRTKPDSAMAARDTLTLLTLRAADFRDSDRREKLEVRS